MTVSTSRITIPEIELVDTVLEAREVLGEELREEDATEPGRVSFGRADPIALTPDVAAGDEALRRELLADREYGYWVLAFTCSFRPGEDPVTEGRLGVRLRLDDDAAALDPPVVHTLEPERLSTRAERTRTFSFSPKVTAVVEVGAEVSQSSTLNVEKAYVLATGKGESVAQWFFRRQPDVALEGMHDLRMIVRSPAGRPAFAEMKITAKIQRRFAGIVPYRASLPDKLRVVRIPGEPRASS